MKKLAYSLLLGVILLSLVGCSNSDKKNETRKSENTAKSILKDSKTDLKKQLAATPKANLNQKIDPKIVPNFVGMTMDQANTLKDSMKDASFVISMSDSVYRADLPEGTILAQSAEPGTEGGGKWVTYITSTQNQNIATDVDKAKF
ncbi:PASTA domain-containing protein [Lactococcus lactis]|uniref:PASTA domain-containing protein n=1 Tax=Lactococcus lactis subsp. lactis A12 TaxID=1137134 RepID=S6FHK9_LACLL|nr:PASTA domain-containing protein [Lactococcus lactis]CDG04801.1 Putative uncharacterized protein [Lactococcus lactis subsp. lactis A12]SBW30918.1 Hypothetical protein LLA12_01769 [Lactococcus lactis subsp. lactis]